MDCKQNILIELIYALHAFKAFDDGSSEIKVIVRIFENTFGIDLGDFYHTYLELRNRKNNRTKFLDLLKDSLIKKWTNKKENKKISPKLPPTVGNLSLEFIRFVI